jgi:hypothetical protein
VVELRKQHADYESRTLKYYRRPLLPLPHPSCDLSKIPCHIETTSTNRTVARFAVATLHASPRASEDEPREREMARMSFANKLQYCQRHGYDLIVEGDDAVDTRRTPAWSKIRVLRKWLPLYEWVLWVDADALFTNWTFRIEDLVGDQLDDMLAAEQRDQNRDRLGLPRREVDLILTHDWNTINSGVFLLRNGSWARSFLRRLWAVPAYLARPFQDQGAMIHLLFRAATAAQDLAHVWNVDNNFLNAYPENLIREEKDVVYAHDWATDWIVHFASCKYFDQCLDWARFYFAESACRNAHDRICVNSPIERFLPRNSVDTQFPALDELDEI